uniref:Reverse transcriptase domain-containing protein n=1 Tax=Ananas comosus var. bracteatus TaxID=296719 RepID=A0A6V7PFX2_ANACO|nr:unnamed protein product [Ananas comosus var. bracteatus]
MEVRKSAAAVGGEGKGGDRRSRGGEGKGGVGRRRRGKGWRRPAEARERAASAGGSEGKGGDGGGSGSGGGRSWRVVLSSVDCGKRQGEDHVHDEVRAYKFLVMPFGLKNAPTIFCTLMNKLFHPYLDHFAVVFLDDFVVFNNTLEEHIEHLRIFFKVLWKTSCSSRRRSA